MKNQVANESNKQYNGKTQIDTHEYFFLKRLLNNCLMIKIISLLHLTQFTRIASNG